MSRLSTHPATTFNFLEILGLCCIFDIMFIAFEFLTFEFWFGSFSLNHICFCFDDISIGLLLTFQVVFLNS
ncbi:hypothetical protein RchiOBHm_Chr2g0128021 [Rosa chinensis]|uniref:Uncharacterized protein n=1 Tax=Rosa chinensis TaxID=74649 RepID=A0A2P6RU77_ROSCH|nr:hypothetical protein RchiOBHm_Chr2g0128021 [Rosa chinensis]